MTGIAALNGLIRAHSLDALPLVAAQGSLCVQDENGQTPLNVAIAAGNKAAFDAIVGAPGALEFAPPLHDKASARLMRTIHSSEGLDDLDEAEARILSVVRVPPYWQRTPLLQACRYGNRVAIAALIGRGAKLTARDLLGQNAVALSLQAGGVAALAYLVDCCIAAKKRFPVDVDSLCAAVPDVMLYERMLVQGRLTAPARRFAFNLACATLNRARIERMLDDGFDVNVAVTYETNPVEEVVTSKLAWLHEAPGWSELAAGHAHMYGDPRAAAIHVPADGRGPTFGQIQAQHRQLNESVRRKQSNPTFDSPERREARLALLDMLCERGLDLEKLRAHASFSLTSDVVATNEPQLLLRLVEMGLRFAPDRGEDWVEIDWAIRHGCFAMVAPLRELHHRLGTLENVPREQVRAFHEWQADNTFTASAGPPSPPEPMPDDGPWWELAGESTLCAGLAPDPPQAGAPCTVELRHCNLYGRRAEVEFRIRLAGEGDDAWRRAQLVRESMRINGVDGPVSELVELPYEETPWEGVFEAELTMGPGHQTIEIELSAPESCGVLDDWTTEVVGPAKDA